LIQFTSSWSNRNLRLFTETVCWESNSFYQLSYEPTDRETDLNRVRTDQAKKFSEKYSISLQRERKDLLEPLEYFGFGHWLWNSLSYSQQFMTLT
jgi:hypothetical protein